MADFFLSLSLFFEGNIWGWRELQGVFRPIALSLSFVFAFALFLSDVFDGIGKNECGICDVWRSSLERILKGV